MLSSGAEVVSATSGVNNICEMCMNLDKRGSSMVFTWRNQYLWQRVAAHVKFSDRQSVARR